MRGAIAMSGLLLAASLMHPTRSVAATPICHDSVCIVAADDTALGTRQPLILVHGWNATEAGWANFLAYYNSPSGSALQLAFKPYLVSYPMNLAPVSALADRLVLDLDTLDGLEADMASRPFFIVAHDMGGLVARAAMQQSQTTGPRAGTRVGDRTAVLITLGTPHHGSPLANTDALYAATGPLDAGALAAIDAYWSPTGPVLYDSRSDLRWDNAWAILDYTTYPLEANSWLSSLNASHADDGRIVTFGGTIPAAAACGGDNYCWMHSVLAGFGAGFNSDGVVPLNSGLWMNADTVTYRASPRIVQNHNHTQMWQGNGTDTLFASVATELTAALPVPCALQVTPLSLNAPAAGGVLWVAITSSSPQCVWSASTASPHISFPAGTGGSGSATLQFSVAGNASGAARVMTFTVAGQTVTVDQEVQPPVECAQQVTSPTTFTVPAAGGISSVSVLSTSWNCAWSAETTAPFVIFPWGTNRLGSQLFQFEVLANATSSPRPFTVIVAGHTINVAQYPVPSAGPEWVLDGAFDSEIVLWTQFATPASNYMISRMAGGVFEFYREVPPPGTFNQAVVFQNTGRAIDAGVPVVAHFDLGNSSGARKRISVLLHDSDFTDLSVCTFWLAPNTPLTTYGMRTHSTKPWQKGTISFYAATAGSDGGYYRLDNVSVQEDAAGVSSGTQCLDPATPAPSGSADSLDLLVNGDFESGAFAPSWFLFGQIQAQLAGGVAEFIKPAAGLPAGVLGQFTGQPLAAGEVLTAALDLGNSSAIRKRVTVILHDRDFSDLSACTFWLEPGTPLATYSLRMFSTKPWTDAALSFYPATGGMDQWFRLDNVTLKRTPSAAISGTSCIGP